jgi:hypothetical protein
MFWPAPRRPGWRYPVRPQRRAPTPSRWRSARRKWSDGKDSFLCDPANADIAILEGSTPHQIGPDDPPSEHDEPRGVSLINLKH